LGNTVPGLLGYVYGVAQEWYQVATMRQIALSPPLVGTRCRMGGWGITRGGGVAKRMLGETHPTSHCQANYRAES